MPNSSWMIKTRNSFEMHCHAYNKSILSKTTAFQYVEIVESVNYGKVLLVDGVPQSSIVDEFIYHETIVHPALCSLINPIDILIIGGGEGNVLREVLKYPSVRKVVMVDIDKELVEICMKHLNEENQESFSDERVELLFEDGKKFLQENSNSFDCIILDLSDPFENSPAMSLFTVDFYRLVKTALKEKGILSLQTEHASLVHCIAHSRIIATLNTVFNNVLPCYAYIPIYSTLFGFAICSDSDLSIEAFTPQQIDDLLLEKGITDLRFFDGVSVKGIIGSPKYLRKIIHDMEKRVITLDDPLYVDS